MPESTAARFLAAFALGCSLATAGIIAADANVALFLRLNGAADRAIPDAALSGATILGNGLCALMLLAPAIARAPRVVAAGVLASPLAAVLSYVPKHLVAEARPAAVLDPGSIHVHGIRLAGTTSFPSGHAITAFTLVAAVLCASPTLRRRPASCAALLAAAILVAASRIGVGAHWPIDALAGAGLGTLAGLGGAWWSARWPFWRERTGALVLTTIVAAAAIALTRIDTGYPAAQPLQYALAALGLVSALFGYAVHLRRSPGASAA
ncbi:MAG TPA: phosphatase PAP2 family protein [Burkholderiaceae bacterium]|nr:phosphatase PAP2 family protein [Burkholderiaceae bacterium]